MSDQIDRTLRAAMGTIVEVAPEAPEVPTVVSKAPVWRGALRYVVAGFAITALFAVVGLLLFDRDGASPADTTPMDTPARPADLLLLPQEGTEGLSLGEVTSEIRSWDGVEFVTSWTGQQAYEEYLRQFPHEERESTAYLAEFPGSVRVWTTDGFDRDAIIAAADGWGYDVSVSREFIPLLADSAAFDPDDRISVHVLGISALPEDLFPLLHIYGTDVAEGPLQRLWIEETNYGGGIPGLLPEDPIESEVWEPLNAPTGSAFVAQGAVGPMILWQPEMDGPVIRVSGLGLSRDELIEIAFEMQPTATGWMPISLPDGFSVLAEGPIAPEGLNVTQFVWPSQPRDDSQPTMLLQQSQSNSEYTEMVLFGMVGRATPPEPYDVDVTDVRGHPAFRVVYLEGTTQATFLTWAEGTNHIVVLYIPGAPVEPIVDALYQLSLAEWEALRQRRLGSGNSSPTTTMATTTITADQ